MGEKIKPTEIESKVQNFNTEGTNIKTELTNNKTIEVEPDVTNEEIDLSIIENSEIKTYETDIEKMRDWDILDYLRYDRNWMVQSHYSREDIEGMYGITFTDNLWYHFCKFSCKCFDYIKESDMNAIIDNWNPKEFEDTSN